VNVQSGKEWWGWYFGPEGAIRDAEARFRDLGVANESQGLTSLASTYYSTWGACAKRGRLIAMWRYRMKAAEIARHFVDTVPLERMSASETDVASRILAAAANWSPPINREWRVRHQLYRYQAVTLVNHGLGLPDLELHTEALLRITRGQLLWRIKDAYGASLDLRRVRDLVYLIAETDPWQATRIFRGLAWYAHVTGRHSDENMYTRRAASLAREHSPDQLTKLRLESWLRWCIITDFRRCQG
jgi:hypothetical protein